LFLLFFPFLSFFSLFLFSEFLSVCWLLLRRGSSSLSSGRFYHLFYSNLLLFSCYTNRCFSDKHRNNNSNTNEAIQSTLQLWERLSLEVISLLPSFDSMLFEARYAREALLSFLALVKDCFNEATNLSSANNNNSTANTPPATVVDYEIR
jgi:hypothetical protein